MERTEKIGFGIATAAHVLLFGILSTGFLSTPNPMKLNSPPMDVSLVDEVALQSAAPQISRQPPPPSVAPEVGETAEPAPAEPVPSPPEPTPPEPTPPPPRPVPRPTPKPAPTTRPAEKAKPKPAAPKPTPEKAKPAKPTPPVERAKPAPAKAKPAAAKPVPAKATAKKPTAAKPAAATGKGKTDRPKGSQLGPDFLKGIQGEAPRSPAPAAPAANVIGAKQKAALDSEIRRQLKPHWKAPTGADAEQLRTIVAVELTPNGAISGSPEVVDTTGITASNRAQVKLHQELAVKAIRLAAPFKLPPDLYDGWKSLRIAFDKRLSQ
ncbi:cell envelope biogenesis protein TolA [Sphingobium sp. SCG-1]|uniref:cell envelope biogenesis protein TolA n=1 Tax=Sphingobium sp. SCG-1 TaxID=2072936 RepID=UPI000CD68B5B|nr:cell envelope biogenesis protein TolA [Sphingobium sp. SCG-1]AUW59513.1 cell envelope biogenesis protein TolA [Sphingobium sp. SCG-1]